MHVDTWAQVVHIFLLITCARGVIDAGNPNFLPYPWLKSHGSIEARWDLSYTRSLHRAIHG